MRATVASPGLGRIPRLLIAIEEPPWQAIYRVAIGFAVFPVLSRLWGDDISGWMAALSFGGILLALRVVPTILRKVLPIPDSVRTQWAARRQIAKEYDSYQWQKLLWFGLGLAGYAALPGQRRMDRMILASICVGAGTFGLAMWRARRPR